MVTKLTAARLAARSGAMTAIANGRTPDVVMRLRRGEGVGTLLVAGVEPLLARKRWIAGQLRTKGDLVLDDGAVRVLREAGRSLLPVGVTAARGKFERGDVVLCVDRHGAAIAKGMVNYSSADTARILGANSEDIETRLGFVAEPELVHRDNLVLL
jgi:glutamate 5-kinase